MEQEPTLVRLDSGPAFHPVLQQSQWTRPRKQFRKDSPGKRPDMQPAKIRVRARQQSTEDDPQNEQPMQEQNGNRECGIEMQNKANQVHPEDLQPRRITIGLIHISRFWDPE